MSDEEIYNLISILIEDKNPKKQITLKKKLFEFCQTFNFFRCKTFKKENTNMESIITDTINNLSFVFYKKNDIIWDIGDKVNETYIIFAGEVIVYNSHKNNNDDNSIKEILGQGYSLGENYSINNFSKRINKIQAKTKCILGSINMKEYLRIFNNINHEEYLLFISFFSDLKLFDNNDFIERTQRTVTKEYYYKNQYIFKQDESYKSFYFINSGTVRLIIHSNEKYVSKIDHDVLIGNNNERFTNERTFEMKGFYEEKINYIIIDLSYGDFIGAIEYLNHFDKYKYDIKCLTDVVVYKMDTEHFRKKAFKQDVKIFHSKILKQEKYIQKRIDEIKMAKYNIAKNRDYLLCQNKFTRTFLLNHPIVENMKDDFINSPPNPNRIKEMRYKKKKLTNIFLTPKIKEIFLENKNSKHLKTKKQLEIKDFMTNIYQNKRLPFYEALYSNCLSNENINKKVKKIIKSRTINIERNKNRHYNILSSGSLTKERNSKIFAMANLKRIINKTNSNFYKNVKKNMTNIINSEKQIKKFGKLMH